MPRSGLNAEAVVLAASRIADRDGLEAVSLARVARALNVKPPSLYNHVDGLVGLRRAMAIGALREVNIRMTRAAVGLSGREALLAIGRAYRGFALEHPGQYLAMQTPADPADAEHGAAGGAVVATVVAVLSGYGLTGDDALHATRGIRALIHGFVGLEAAGGFGLALDEGQSLDRALGAYSDGIEKWGRAGR